MTTTLLLAAIPASGLLVAFLYAVLAIALIGGLIWAINTYIHPIPPPILAVLSIVLVILIVLWFLNGTPRL